MRIILNIGLDALSKQASAFCIMKTRLSAVKLDWPALCDHVRRRWLYEHRGEMPARSTEALPLAVPVGIAACAQFGQHHWFATEQEAQTWRWIGPRALNVCNLWAALRYDREDVRISVGAVRYWRQRGDVRQAELTCAELRQRWASYRRGMRTMAGQLGWVRKALTPPRAAMDVATPTRQAAE